MVSAASIFVPDGIMFATFDTLPLIANIGRDAQTLGDRRRSRVRPIEWQPKPAWPVLLSYR
jgi:hypothetical protein